MFIKKALHHTGKVEESVGKASACRMRTEVTTGQENVPRVNVNKRSVWECDV